MCRRRAEGHDVRASAEALLGHCAAWEVHRRAIVAEYSRRNQAHEWRLSVQGRGVAATPSRSFFLRVSSSRAPFGGSGGAECVRRMIERNGVRCP